MANTSLKTEIHSICNVKLQFLQHAYKKVEFFIMPDLVSDVIIGDDLLERHNSMTFQFNGKLPNLVISLIMPTAQVEYLQLFSHMVPTCKPIAIKTRKFSAADQELIRIETKCLLQGRIEKSNSPWRPQPVRVDHGNDKNRMCIDFSQTVNLYTMLDAYPLPTIESIVNEVAKWKYISTLDLKSAYHQIQINPKDWHFTAFQSGNELYQWKYLPFGLTNTVPAFQRAIIEFIAQHDLKCTNAYLDNIILGGMTQQEHDDNLTALRRTAKVDQFTFNKEKSQYNCTEISLLGYRVGGGVTKSDPHRVQALQDLQMPTTKKELQRIMGLFAYYVCQVDSQLLCNDPTSSANSKNAAR